MPVLPTLGSRRRLAVGLFVGTRLRLAGRKGHFFGHGPAAGYRRAWANRKAELHTLAHRGVTVGADGVPPVGCVPFEAANVGRSGSLARNESCEAGEALHRSMRVGPNAAFRLTVEPALL